MQMEQAPSYGMSILVVDDNAPNQALFRAMLQQVGHNVSVADNGQEAVAAVQSGSYDLILMDVSMPQMNGLEATEAIRELGGRYASIPIIAVTANAMKGDKKRYLDAGMTDYLTKPVHMDVLLKTVEKQRPFLTSTDSVRQPTLRAR